MFRVVELSILFFWDFNHYSTCGIGKRINSFVLGIEQSLSFFSSLFGGRMLSVLYALILISAYICFKLIYVYDRSFGFSFVLVSYVIRDFLSYFIFNTHGCIQRIYISSLSARMEEFFFMIIHISHVQTSE